jgi:hypothetical protein
LPNDPGIQPDDLGCRKKRGGIRADDLGRRPDDSGILVKYPPDLSDDLGCLANDLGILANDQQDFAKYQRFMPFLAIFRQSGEIRGQNPKPEGDDCHQKGTAANWPPLQGHGIVSGFQAGLAAGAGAGMPLGF